MQGKTEAPLHLTCRKIYDNEKTKVKKKVRKKECRASPGTPFCVISKAPLIFQVSKLSYKSNARESQFSLAFDFADI